MSAERFSRIVSIFGSHAPEPGSEDYERARWVGRLLAEAGFAIATGGYEGVMAAASQGAADAGGRVIGVTSPEIERYRGASLNRWVHEEIRYATSRQRLLHLVENNEGMLVLPGGVGTLAEFSLAWSLLQVKAMAPRPLVLIGSIWGRMLAAFVHPDYVSGENLNLLVLTDSAEEAVGTLVGRI